jgi:hypothetical protein
VQRPAGFLSSDDHYASGSKGSRAGIAEEHAKAWTGDSRTPGRRSEVGARLVPGLDDVGQKTESSMRLGPSMGSGSQERGYSRPPVPPLKRASDQSGCRISPNDSDHFFNMPCSLPRWIEQVRVGFLPCPRGLPQLLGGSASTTSLSRPAQASLALRPARLLARLWRTFVPRLQPSQLPG